MISEVEERVETCNNHAKISHGSSITSCCVCRPVRPSVANTHIKSVPRQIIHERDVLA